MINENAIKWNDPKTNPPPFGTSVLGFARRAKDEAFRKMIIWRVNDDVYRESVNNDYIGKDHVSGWISLNFDDYKQLFNEWIDITTQQPELSVAVWGFVRLNPFSDFQGAEVVRMKNGYVATSYNHYVSQITHWMKLPLFPNIDRNYWMNRSIDGWINIKDCQPEVNEKVKGYVKLHSDSDYIVEDVIRVCDGYVPISSYEHYNFNPVYNIIKWKPISTKEFTNKEPKNCDEWIDINNYEPEIDTPVDAYIKTNDNTELIERVIKKMTGYVFANNQDNYVPAAWTILKWRIGIDHNKDEVINDNDGWVRIGDRRPAFGMVVKGYVRVEGVDHYEVRDVVRTANKGYLLVGNTDSVMSIIKWKDIIKVNHGWNTMENLPELGRILEAYVKLGMDEELKLCQIVRNEYGYHLVGNPDRIVRYIENWRYVDEE